MADKFEIIHIGTVRVSVEGMVSHFNLLSNM